MTAITERLGDVTNVLVGADSMHRGADGVCVDLLSQAQPDDVSVLWVSFRKSPGDCLAGWREEHGADPGEFGVVAVGDTASAGRGDGVDPQLVETISNPSDLTGLGITIGEFISGRDEAIAVCFDSLTALLQYVDLETAYEFLHALTGQLYNAGAVSHFHLDPSAHDEQTVETLLMLFDAFVDLRDEEPAIRTRYPPVEA